MVGFCFANYTVLHTPVRSTKKNNACQDTFFRDISSGTMSSKQISSFLNKKIALFVAYARNLEPLSLSIFTQPDPSVLLGRV